MDLSIIIVSFNTKKITKDCIESVVKNTKGIKYEIIVVDNDSKDGSVNLLKELSEKYLLKLIAKRNNVGFGKANNIGMKIAKGKYILLLNSDTIIKDNVLKEMIDWMNKNKQAGVSTCALKNKDGSLQGTGGYFPNLFQVFSWMFFIEDIPLVDKLIKPFHPMHPHSPFYKGEAFFEKLHQQDWITGAFMLFRREIINQAGYFDDDYFAYVEEVDYCWRIKSKGWEVWYLPQWSIVHLGGASSTKEFPILSEIKGIKIFYSKHKPEFQQKILRLFLKCGMFLRMMLFGVIKGKEEAKLYAKAFSTV